MQVSFVSRLCHSRSMMSRWSGLIGVIGLTTAIVLQEKGDYHVTIVADVFPGDERSSRYTSCWAVSRIMIYPFQYQYLLIGIREHTM